MYPQILVGLRSILLQIPMPGNQILSHLKIGSETPQKTKLANYMPITIQAKSACHILPKSIDKILLWLVRAGVFKNFLLETIICDKVDLIFFIFFYIIIIQQGPSICSGCDSVQALSAQTDLHLAYLL